jgi:hypothetical protein
MEKVARSSDLRVSSYWQGFIVYDSDCILCRSYARLGAVARDTTLTKGRCSLTAGRPITGATLSTRLRGYRARYPCSIDSIARFS